MHMSTNDISPETQRKIDMLEAARDAMVRRAALVEALTKFANGASREEIAEFATDLSHEHRTLQQGVFGMFLQYAKVLASNYEKGNFDGRNEYACKTASTIMNMTNNCAGVPLV
jgi:hypothetical protein